MDEAATLKAEKGEKQKLDAAITVNIITHRHLIVMRKAVTRIGQTRRTTTMASAEEVVKSFYSAFEKKDAEAMAALYAPDATFNDPAFTDLNAQDAGDMWRMLLSKADENFKIVVTDIKGDGGENGSAHWEATYKFGPNRRDVINKIDAAMVIKNGKIVKHVDTFGFYTWSTQALGLPAYLFGWTGWFQNKVKAGAVDGLRKWQKKQAEKNAEGAAGAE